MLYMVAAGSIKTRGKFSRHGISLKTRGHPFTSRLLAPEEPYSNVEAFMLSQGVVLRPF